MDQIFPYANVIVGALVFIVGFVFHWVGQFISILNWEFAIKIGLQEKGPREFQVYENAIAKADVLLGWIYGIAGIGLIVDASWSCELLWFPGVVLIYHSLSYWHWTTNQHKMGHRLHSNTFKMVWTLSNLITGLLAVIVASQAG